MAKKIKNTERFLQSFLNLIWFCVTDATATVPDAAFLPRPWYPPPLPPAPFLPCTHQWSHWLSAWIFSQLNPPSQLCVLQTDALTLDNLDPHELTFRLVSKSGLNVGDALLHSAAVPRVGYRSQFFDTTPISTLSFRYQFQTIAFLKPDVLKPIWKIIHLFDRSRAFRSVLRMFWSSEPRPGPSLPSAFYGTQFMPKAAGFQPPGYDDRQRWHEISCRARSRNGVRSVGAIGATVHWSKHLLFSM